MVIPLKILLSLSCLIFFLSQHITDIHNLPPLPNGARPFGPGPQIYPGPRRSPRWGSIQQTLSCFWNLVVSNWSSKSYFQSEVGGSPTKAASSGGGAIWHRAGFPPPPACPCCLHLLLSVLLLLHLLLLVIIIIGTTAECLPSSGPTDWERSERQSCLGSRIQHLGFELKAVKHNISCKPAIFQLCTAV